MRHLLLFAILFVSNIITAQTCTDDALSLCGKWDFYCSGGQNSKKWKKITVPSCWELQGFGDYTYGRFYKTKGLKASDETGRYRRQFSVPRSWSGKTIQLVFEGSMTDTEVWIDGKSVGAVHQGGFTEFKYDVTPLIVPGRKHTIEVLVSKESANKSVNSAERRADWWLFGGIYRPVYLKAVPKVHIEDLAIDARQDGMLTASMLITNTTEVPDMSVSLHDMKGNTITLAPKEKHSTAEGNGIRMRYLLKADGIRAWDPEHPNLYRLTVATHEGHQVTERIGFRTVEFRERDGIYLNGTKLLVKGTNRHCFWPETGRTVTREQSLMDARIIKQMNMNAVRSHYPPDRHFLEICDSMGLLYLDELPGWQTHYDDTMAVKMIREFIPRDVNHPCIFLWSNGNEGGWNTSIDHLFAELDIQRRKVVHPWADYDGIDTHHYPAYQTGAYRLHNGQHVFMPTEFLHSKYDKGGGAALEDMWSHWTASPLFAGGFIWAYVDEAVRRTDMGGILDSDGGNGPDGVLNAYRQPEGSYYAIREVWSPVHVSLKDIDRTRKVARLYVENRYLFARLDECLINGTSLPAALPGERVLVEVPYTDDDVLRISAERNGEAVCEWSWPMKHAADQMPLNGKGEKMEVTFTDNGILRIGELEGPFPVGMAADCYRHTERTEADGSRVHTYYYRGGVDSIQWRLTPDGSLLMDAVILNDERGHGYQGQWLKDESKWQIGFTFNYDETNVDSVRWMGRGPYRVWRNRLQGQQFGVWAKAYNNTVTGQYNSLEAPLYPEFKGYYADMRWAEFITKNHRDWSVTSLTDGLYLRLFTPEEAIDQTPGEMGGMQEGTKPKQERTMVRFPEGNISFLISIPPMQSYKPLEQLGPHSQPDNIRIKSGDEGFHIRLALR